MTKSFRIYLPLVLTALIGACTSGKDIATAEFELSFWLREGAKMDPRIIDTHDHCCCSGTVAVARVTRMPSVDRFEVLEVERVLELSDRGTIVRQWGMPIDSIVNAISGSQIIVLQREGRALSISEKDDLAMTSLPKHIDHGILIECPPIKEFGESAYLRCFELRDTESGKARRIAYQGPCT